MIRMTLLTMVALQSSPPASYWQCELPVSLRCGPRGCVEERNDLRVHFAGFEHGSGNVYRRCLSEDRSECERYRAYPFERDGRTVLQLPGLPAYATVASDLSIVEVLGIGEDVLISKGACRRVAPPVIIRPPRPDE